MPQIHLVELPTWWFMLKHGSNSPDYKYLDIVTVDCTQEDIDRLVKLAPSFAEMYELLQDIAERNGLG